MAKKRIGILTGGGDVPGLNAVIKSVVYGSTDGDSQHDVVGLHRGWEGLTHVNLKDGTDDEYVFPLNRNNTRSIDRTGGTYLHTSRTNPTKMKVDKLPEHVKGQLGRFKEVADGIVDVTPLVLDNLQALGIDYVVAIGGDDTLSYASVLHREGVPIVCVPKTMDNDVRNTEYCVGFSTAMTRAMITINRLRTTVGSHERIGVMRVFGRDAGFTALYTAYVTNIRCCIPELPFDLDKLCDILVQDKKNNPSHYAMVLLSEGATWTGRDVESYGDADAFGHKKKINIAEAFSDQLKHKTGHETVVADLTYELRSGEPDFMDKMIATTFATMALECITGGETGRMMAIQNGCYALADIPDPALGPRCVEVATTYDADRFRPRYSGKHGLPILMARA